MLRVAPPLSRPSAPVQRGFVDLQPGLGGVLLEWGACRPLGLWSVSKLPVLTLSPWLSGNVPWSDVCDLNSTGASVASSGECVRVITILKGFLARVAMALASPFIIGHGCLPKSLLLTSTNLRCSGCWHLISAQW